LTIDGRTAFRSPGSDELRDVLIKVYGLETANSLLEIKHVDNDAPIKVSGLVSPPHISRSSRSYLSFFVNRRWVNSWMLSYAVEEAYRGMLMVGKHPIAVVNILLPPQEMDVNVHPTKREVRFRSEHEVFSSVQQAVRATLLEQKTIPSLKVPPVQTTTFDVAAQKPLAQSMPMSPAQPARTLPILRILGQLQATYIIAEGPDGMYLIDQHAAHERVLFEKLRDDWAQRKVEAQGLLEPVPIEFTARQEESLKAQWEILVEYGFGIEPFGERTYLIRSIPALLTGRDVTQTLIEILDSPDKGAVDWREEIAISLACHGAIRAGQVLSQHEMQELVQQLERAKMPKSCPHGRPTMIQLPTSRLEKEFGRR
jgi:DNA mismatch repair protein MutL